MLKNQKVLSNNNKILRGIHLESYMFYDNETSGNITLSTSGLTSTSPLYVYISTSNNYTKNIYTSDITNTTITLTDGTVLDKTILTYGNNAAVNSIRFTLGTNYTLDGDLKSFINLYPSLEEFYSTVLLNTITSLNNFFFPTNLKTLHIERGYNLTGDLENFNNIKNIEHLYLSFTKIGGVIDKYDGLKYLYYRYYSTNKLSGNASNFNFISNLEFLYLYNTEFSGSMSDWTFNNNLNYFYLYLNYSQNSNISNWDFSNTILTNFTLVLYNNVTGSLDGQIMPNTLEDFEINTSSITSLQIDLSNTSLINFNLTILNNVSSNIEDIILPDSVDICNIQQMNNLSGSFNNFYFPKNSRYLFFSFLPSVGGNINGLSLSGLTSLERLGINNLDLLTGDLFSIDNSTNVDLYYIYNNPLITGNASGMTLWENLVYYRIYDNNLTGTLSSTNTTIPSTLNQFFIYNNDIILDLSSSFDFKNTKYIDMSNISGITGNFSNLIINSLDTFYLFNNNFSIDIGNLTFNWSVIKDIRIYSSSTNNSDITNWFPVGQTLYSGFMYLLLYNSDFIGDISNWTISGITSANTTFQINNNNLSGDISNWNIPYNTYIYNNSLITGNVGTMNFTIKNRNFQGHNTSIYGNLSGVTNRFDFLEFYVYNNSGITGTNEYMDYLWINRKNWTYDFNVNISNVGDYPNGIYQLGDLGTYIGNEWDLTETEINNLVNGNDYDGLGTSTPWSTLEKYYYQKNAKLTSSSSTPKYKITSIIY